MEVDQPGLVSPPSPVGAVELQRGCESGSSGAEDFACAAAIAASLGLDSSHIWAVLLSRVVFGAMALAVDLGSGKTCISTRCETAIDVSLGIHHVSGLVDDLAIQER